MSAVGFPAELVEKAARALHVEACGADYDQWKNPCCFTEQDGLTCSDVDLSEEAAAVLTAVAPDLIAEERALLAEVTEERDMLKRGGATLGEIVVEQGRTALDATGRHDLIGDDGDGDWGAVWEHLMELRPRAERAEAQVAAVRRSLNGRHPVPFCSNDANILIETLAHLRSLVSDDGAPS